MEDLAFAHHLLLRMPAQAAAAYLRNSQEFLDDPFFLAGLFLASPGFYFRVAQSGFTATALSRKEKTTLLKYINRTCFRPTPFGLFSSVALISWGGEDLFVAGERRPGLMVRADELFTANFTEGTLPARTESTGLHLFNPSTYRAGDEYRFIRTGLDESGRSREYQLQSIAYSKLLKDLAGFCGPGKLPAAIVNWIGEQAGCTPEEAKDYFEFLKASQLMVDGNRPGITGEDRLAGLLDSIGPSAGASLRGILAQMKKPEAVPGYFISVSSGLRKHLPPAKDPGNDSLLNVTLFHKPAGSINSKYRQWISEGLTALSILCPQEIPESLKQFINAFNTYFEGQRVPLLKIMDPENGIGYQQPSADAGNDLLETLNIEQKANRNDTIAWSSAHAFLLRSWHSAMSAGEPAICLQEKALSELAKGLTRIYSPGISVLFRIKDNGVFIESAGGNNAVALMGRFTPADPAIHSAAQEIAARQEALNPDILFAEILHLSDPHTDNVNRRERLWSWEIPVTAGPTAGFDGQLDLADLYVTVEQGKVVLRSEKHGKAVVPRLSSAYNHRLNKLPLFRFLADIPYQYGQYDLTLDLRQYFPGQSYYPRVVYKNAVIHPATWIITADELTPLRALPYGGQPEGFKQLMETINLPLKFMLSEGDQQLVFNRARTGDITFFISCTLQKKEIILKEIFDEAIFNEENKKEKAFVRQYNTFLYPEKPMLFPAATDHREASAAQRKFLPGSEWLYLKLYTPKASSCSLLLRLLPLLNKKYQHGKAKKWFFIRYEDHAPHLRLRMQAEPADIPQILSAFKSRLETGINEHVIREYHIDVYSRELERYSAASPELTESHFHASSEVVAGFLKAQRRSPGLPVWPFALLSVRELTAVFIPDPDGQIAFSYRNYEKFSFEFNREGLRVELDRQYRKLAPVLRAGIADNRLYQINGPASRAMRFRKSALRLKASALRNKGDIYALLESIIHMHLNRVFSDEARKQEMIIYYFLYKFLLSEKGRYKNER